MKAEFSSASKLEDRTIFGRRTDSSGAYKEWRSSVFVTYKLRDENSGLLELRVIKMLNALFRSLWKALWKIETFSNLQIYIKFRTFLVWKISECWTRFVPEFVFKKFFSYVYAVNPITHHISKKNSILVTKVQNVLRTCVKCIEHIVFIN